MAQLLPIPEETTAEQLDPWKKLSPVSDSHICAESGRGWHLLEVHHTHTARVLARLATATAIIVFASPRVLIVSRQVSLSEGLLVFGGR